MPKKRKVIRTPEQWRGIIKEQEESGLSVAEYCELEEIASSSFSKWKHRINQTQQEASRFVELSQSRSQDSIKVELCFSNGMILRIS